MLLTRPDSRTIVIGKTGSGKTCFAKWLLSRADFDRRPWVIFDYKRTDFGLWLRQRLATLVSTNWRPGSRTRGIYIVQPDVREGEQVEAMLWALFSRGNLGILIDEIYSMPMGMALRALLTQGRSRRIQMIILTQRPFNCSREVLSEADYYSVFRVSDAQDFKRILEVVPLPCRSPHDLPREYSSIWYEDRDDALYKVLPVPDEASIFAEIDRRLPIESAWF